MRVKRIKNNEFVLEEGVWIRNPFCESKPLDINSLAKSESSLLLQNESDNLRRPYMQIDEAMDLSFENVVIVSDGHLWEERQLALGDLPSKQVKVLGVNGSLSKWRMVGDGATIKRTMAFYVVNNPYPECMGYLPRYHRYYPNLISSTRTFPGFLREYKNEPYMYRPTQDLDFSGAGFGDVNAVIDDYRNPVCAAISIAAKRGAKKIALMCCDESFEEGRPGSERMENGLYQYPQQIKCQKIIDKHLFWVRSAGIDVVDCSSGLKMNNARYIDAEGLRKFFERN